MESNARIPEPRPERLVADAVGRLIELWGFRAVMGRIWATLYLSEDPLSAAQLCERLEISTGAASMALRDLERWGMVIRRRAPGDRKDWFEAETDVWKGISRVFRERELMEIGRAIEAFEEAASRFERGSRLGRALERRASRLALGRTTRLLELARVGRTLLRALVDHGRLDAGPLRSWARRAR
ncbi:MAG TPA: MarR family transcriptional regulator [Vulgatibacter sp.]